MAGIGLVLDPISENNLVANPGFEEGTAGWSLLATSWASSALSNPTSSFSGSAGAKVARVQATKDATGTLRPLFLFASTAEGSIIPGQLYSLSIPLNVVDSPTKGVFCYLEWQKANGEGISNSLLSSTVTTTGETRLTLTNVVAPALASIAKIVVQANSETSGDTVDFSVDNIQLGAGGLDINDGVHFRAMKAQYPKPPRKVNWASSADTEGATPASMQYDNRVITIECRVYGTSASDLQTQLGYLDQKMGRVNDPNELTTHEYVSPSGKVCIFDLLEGAAEYELDNTALANKRTLVTITLTAKPFWRAGAANEVAGEAHKETTLPFIVGVDKEFGGDVPALGRLVISEEQAQNQWTAIWGTQSHYYDSSVNAELFYEAETRTPLGSSEKKAAPAGASGAGENSIFNGSLIPSYQAVMSTQKAGGGAHLSNIGTFRAFARILRPATNVGSVSVALEWAQSDFLRPTLNTAKTYAANELEGVWTLVDLGLVQIQKVTGGTQRWEGRVAAKSTVGGDDIYVDCLAFFPVDEGYGALKVVPTLTTPSALSGHDEFDQGGGGTLAGKVAPVGGTWSEEGHAGSFGVDSTNHYVTRTAVSDEEGKGRVGILGSTSFTNIVVGADIFIPGDPIAGAGNYGVVCRYSSITKGFYAWFNAFNSKEPNSWGVSTSGFAGDRIAEGNFPAQVHDQWNQLRVVATADGNWQFWFNGTLLAAGFYAPLATGGELATGRVGIYDQHPQSGANTRLYDNFVAFPPTPDAAVFASRKAEVRSDRYQREDSTGTVLVPRTDYKGSYFKPQPARREARSVRTIVKLSRFNIDTMQDLAIDDASFRVFWQARGLGLPES